METGKSLFRQKGILKKKSTNAEFDIGAAETIHELSPMVSSSVY